MPFVEAAQYGIAPFHPPDNEPHVTKRDGQAVPEGDCGPDPGSGPKRAAIETTLKPGSL